MFKFISLKKYVSIRFECGLAFQIALQKINSFNCKVNENKKIITIVKVIFLLCKKVLHLKKQIKIVLKLLNKKRKKNFK